MPKLKAEIKLDSRAYDELCEAFCELNYATEGMSWLNESKDRIMNAIKGIRIERDYDIYISGFNSKEG